MCGKVRRYADWPMELHLPSDDGKMCLLRATTYLIPRCGGFTKHIPGSLVLFEDILVFGVYLVEIRVPVVNSYRTELALFGRVSRRQR